MFIDYQNFDGSNSVVAGTGQRFFVLSWKPRKEIDDKLLDDCTLNTRNVIALNV